MQVLEPFVAWSPSHLVALALTLTVPFGLAWICRRDSSGRLANVVAYSFAALLLGEIIILFFWLDRGPSPRWYQMLPLELCDLTLFACVIACVSCKQIAYELAYFWGLAGSSQGLLTPDLAYDFPAPQFWFFFVGHGGIVGSVVFMTVALGLRPRRGAVLRAYAAVIAYALVAAGVNVLFGTNYGYLRAKPGVPSLLDWLGPWPWYIGSMAALALVLFTLLYLPWIIADRMRSTGR